MRFFRTGWLKKPLPFLLLALLCAQPICAGEQPCGGDDQDSFFLRTAQYFETISASLRMLQIKYGHDVIPLSIAPVFWGVLSERNEDGGFIAPATAVFFANRYRGPPWITAAG